MSGAQRKLFYTRVFHKNCSLNESLIYYCACYEHRKEIRQFHLEQRESQLVRDPDWSLGKHVRTQPVREVHEGDSAAAAQTRPITEVNM